MSRTEQAVARRRPPVKFAGAAPELSRLGLVQLRAYRAALSAEEDKVSYWRRLLQGRIDLLEEQAIADDALSLADLVRVLGNTGSGRTRRALMRVPAPAQLPDLPDLDELCHLWVSDPQDVDEVSDVIKRLHAKENRLSEYRSGLHQRIDAATGELMMRYRSNPRAALMLLPQE